MYMIPEELGFQGIKCGTSRISVLAITRPSVPEIDIAAVGLGGMSRSLGFGGFLESFETFRSRAGGEESKPKGLGRHFSVLMEALWENATGAGVG